MPAALPIALAGGLLVAGQPAFAQEAPMAQSPRPTAGDALPARDLRTYDIPAGPLGPALARFASETGVLLAATPELVQGRHSPGLRGTFTLQDALDGLLAHSGLTARRNARGEFALVAAERTQTLPAVTVTAGIHAPGPAREKVDQVGVSRLGMKVIDTPMTIRALTAATAGDQAAQTIADVVRNVPGVTSSTYSGTYSGLMSRGFWMSTTNANLRNGFRFAHLVEPGRHNVARYEVIKGPMSMEYGRVEPGGLLNIITRQPQAESLREITVSTGQRGTHDIGVDLAGAIDEDARIQYRLTGGSARDAYRNDAVEPRANELALALAWQATSATRVQVDYESVRRRQLTDPGVPVPTPGDIHSARPYVDKFYGDPMATFVGRMDLFTTRLDHRLNDAWSVSLGYSKNNVYRDPRQIRLDGVTGGLVGRTAYTFDAHHDIDTYLAEVKGDLQLAGMRHRIGLTVDIVNLASRYGSPSSFDDVAPIALASPRFTGAPAMSAPYDSTASDSARDRGIAVWDYVEVNRWLNVLAGLRHSWYRTVGYHENVESQPEQKDSQLDPTLALIVKPRPSVSVYGSFTRSSSPNDGTRTAVASFAPPSRARQFEIGTKAEWFDDRLRTSAAWFDLTKTNVPTRSTIDPRYQEITGEVRSRGWEFEVVGKLTDRWNIQAAYAITDSEITRDNTAANLGKSLAYTPKRAASLWTTYALDGLANGWTVGAGLFHAGAQYLDNANLARLPSHTVVDAMVTYAFRTTWPGARLQLNVRNVADRIHYLSADTSGADFIAVYPGLRRTVFTTLILPF